MKLSGSMQSSIAFFCFQLQTPKFLHGISLHQRYFPFACVHHSIVMSFLYLAIYIYVYVHRVGYDVSDHEVRVLSLDTLINTAYNDDDTISINCCRSVLEKVTELYNGLLAVKCYSNFPNALSHRQRHRLLCLLLSILPAFSKVCAP